MYCVQKLNDKLNYMMYFRKYYLFFPIYSKFYALKYYLITYFKTNENEIYNRSQLKNLWVRNGYGPLFISKVKIFDSDIMFTDLSKYCSVLVSISRADALGFSNNSFAMMVSISSSNWDTAGGSFTSIFDSTSLLSFNLKLFTILL